MLHPNPLSASVFVLLWIPVAVGLQCFQCESTISREDCLKRKQTVTCGRNKDRCGAMTFDSGIYSMNCYDSQTCASTIATKACKDGNIGDKCGLSCCSWDFCNDGRPEPPSRAPGTKQGLKCHKCFSSESWRDCSRKQTEVTCEHSEDRCIKTFFLAPVKGTSMKIYAKGCASASLCASSGVCQSFSTEQGNSTCEVSCCSSDFCTQEKTFTCFECASYDSMADCEENQQFVTCHPHKNRCATRAITQGSYPQFLKYCTTKASCEKDLCARRSSPDCRLQCCEGSHCNKFSRGDIFMPSNVALLVYAAATWCAL